MTSPSFVNNNKHASDDDGKGKLFTCSVCQEGFVFKSNLHKHLKKHIGKQPYECPICGIAIRQKHRIDSHISSHIDEAYKCDICQKEFISNLDLLSHTRKHKKILSCYMCQESFPNNGALKKHYRVHVKQGPFECVFCHKNFESNAALKVHYRVHTGEKPFKCLFCFKDFSTKASLKIHYRIHTGEKPFVCDICQRGFAAKVSWLAHARFHTLPERTKKSYVKKTKEKVSYSQVLKVEKKIYSCNVCKKSFSHQTEFSLHLRRHDGENPFSCDICKEGFYGKYELFKHIQTHSKTHSLINLTRALMNH